MDPALLRPGRFDRLVYLGVAGGMAERARVLTSLTRKFHLAEGCTAQAVASLLPDQTTTGADLYAVCAEASLNAVARKVKALEAGCEVEREVVVGMGDFEVALERFVPSVTEADLEYYKGVKEAMQEA